MDDPKNVLVLEYFVGGGFPGEDLSDGLAAEALGMLWAILADFQKWPGVKTVSLLDPRFENTIPGLNRATLPADTVVCSPHRDHEEKFLSTMEQCDAALIIAPETGGILSRLSSEVESAGCKLLGCSPAAIDRAGDKEVCSRILSRAGLPTPDTRIAGFNSLTEILSHLVLPVVLKPLDGVGSEGVSLVKAHEDITAAVAAVRKATSGNRVLLQPFMEGVHASVSLLAAEGRSFPLSLNRQWLQPGVPFEYQGSTVPYDCEQAQKAMGLACSAVNQIDGMRGYVGVDIVLQKNSVQVIEINPRLTTSYIALRQTARTNPAEAICRACVQGILPESFPLNAPVDVWKNDPVSWGLRAVP